MEHIGLAIRSESMAVTGRHYVHMQNKTRREAAHRIGAVAVDAYGLEEE